MKIFTNASSEMDIDLLSKMVKELILDEEEVSLPGIGSFVAETLPATFSDKGFTINPPYRRLSFRPKEARGNRLAEFYAKNNNLDISQAERIIRDFLQEMRQALQTKKSISFPGLGKLRATRENYFFFVCDEDMDIYPEGFGLEPISLKTHEATEEEVSKAITGLASLVRQDNPDTLDDVSDMADPGKSRDVPVTLDEDSKHRDEIQEPEMREAIETIDGSSFACDESASESQMETTEEGTSSPEEIKPVHENDLQPEVSAEVGDSTTERNDAPDGVTNPDILGHDEVPATEAAAETTVAGKASGGKIALRIFIGLLMAAVVSILIFVVLAHVAPTFVDSILYTQEELEILNTPIN